MKKYTAPEIQLTCDKDQRISGETLSWSLQSDSHEILVESWYDEIEYEDYLKEQGETLAAYDDDELQSIRCFQRRPEAVAVCRIACDSDVVEEKREWDDEEGHHVEVLSKSQPVAFELRLDSFMDEYMESGEDYILLAEDIADRILVFRKDGQWWFFQLGRLELLCAEGEDDQWGENEDSQPYHCHSVYPLSRFCSYQRGGESWSAEEWDNIPVCQVGVSQDIKMVCETEDGQGILVFDGEYADIQMLSTLDEDQDIEGDEENQLWDTIHLIEDQVFYLEKYQGEHTTRQLVLGSVWETLASYKEGAFGSDSHRIELKVLTSTWETSANQSTATKALRLVQGNRLTLVPLIPCEVFGAKSYVEMEKNPLFKKSAFGVMPVTYRIVARSGESFAIRYEEESGDGLRRTDYILQEGQLIGENGWDEVTMICGADDSETVFQVKRDGYWGLVNSCGTVLAPLRYSWIQAVRNPELDTCNASTEQVSYYLYLEEFGKRGLGVLYRTKMTQEEPEKDEYGFEQIRMESSFEEFGHREKSSASQLEFCQTIPCEYELVEALTEVCENIETKPLRVAGELSGACIRKGVRVEKMGRSAVYRMDGTLSQPFKSTEQ